MENIKKIKFKLFICSLSFFIIYFGVAFSMLMIKPKEITNKKSTQKITEIKSKTRGNIYDNNGYLLATTIRKYDLIINPSYIKDSNKFELEFKKIFGNKINFNFKDKLSSNLKYLKVKKNISLKDYNRVLKIGEPGIKLEESYIRKYPGKSLVAHIIGKVDVDGKGISGIEKKLDNELSSSQDINLSIDSGIQNIFKKLLLEQIVKFQANAGAGIIMNANNGKIKSIISLPDYDNNINNNLTKEQLFNNATKGLYELGSTLKIFTAAMAIESGKVKDDQLIDVSSPILLSKSQKISDIKKINFPINLPEIIVYSSNIGMAKIASSLGHEIQKKYFNLLGFNQKVGIEIIETSIPSIRYDNRPSSLMSKSYGYGIQISPLHLTKATAIALNGGNLVSPTLLKDRPKLEKNIKVLSNKTSEKLRSILYLVVNDKNGTGKSAKSFYYPIGGKTGTVKKFIDGKYSKTENIVAFTGAFPIHKPEYVFTIVIDQPKPQKFSAMRNTAGWVIAPMVGKLINRISPILKIKPLNFLPSELGLKNYKIRGATL